MVLLSKTTKFIPLCLKYPSNLWKNFYRLNTSDVAPLKSLNIEARRLILEHQSHRSVLHVKGENAASFLQGLTTNDINSLKEPSNKCIYSMFLNKGGRILYDTIIYRTNDTTAFLIECDASISQELERHLLSYSIRREIEVNRQNKEYQVWVVFDTTASEDVPVDDISINLLSLLNTKDLIASFDPRQSSLGLRILYPVETTFLNLSRVLSQIQQTENSANIMGSSSSEDNYQKHRYKFGVAEGPNEMPPGKCFALEANGDLLNGVSFNKGCYLGQELTARVHHTGVVRKRHMPLKLSESCDTLNSTNTITDLEGKKIGSVLCSLEDRALALLNVSQALESNGLMLNGHPCFAKIPKWWPEKVSIVR